MKSKQRLLGVLLTLTLVFLVVGAPLLPRPAQASYEDAAIFYDELGQHGSWVDYDKYGPVWYPKQVEEDWRPYTNGRWTPSEQGYLFETNEPWGWATYHYGNWMPTENYGWVWVPGRTWYPNTVTWRTSPENVAPDASYIGWAPIPPPGYVPPPSYASPPPGYGGGPGYYGGGYGGYPGGSALDLLTAPFWIFAQASRFLLGFGQPYAPAYSYSGCGCLAPPSYYQVIYPTTTIIRSWYYPSYYQPAYFGSGLAPGAYSWGPPVRYVSRVTRINYITINNYAKRRHIDHVRGGWPDAAVFRRNRHLRRIVPSENPRTWARPMQVRNEQAAIRHLGNPRAIVRPADLKPLDRARIPKATVMPARQMRPGQPVRVKGMELPRRAQQQVTPQMAERMKSLRPTGAEGPASPGRGPGARGRGQWVTPEGPQKGIVGGSEGQRGRRVGPGEGPGMRRGPVTKEGFQQPGGVRRGPDVGPGMRRGPVTKEGLQGPGAHGVRRGPVEPPEKAKGVRRGPVPVEGFQGPGPQGVRRGPVEAPEGSKGIRRGPGEGFQPQEQQRRQQMQQQQMRQQQEQQRRQQMQQQQMRQPQEQQRRQQMQQQQMRTQQIRQQQEQQRRQQMQQQQMRQQQEQQRRQQIQQQQRQQQQDQQRRQKIREQQEQSRRYQMRQQQEQSRRQQEPRRARQAQSPKKERQQQHSRNQRAVPPSVGER